MSAQDKDTAMDLTVMAIMDQDEVQKKPSISTETFKIIDLHRVDKHLVLNLQGKVQMIIDFFFV